MNELLELSQRWNLFSIKIISFIFGGFFLLSFCPHLADPGIGSLKYIALLGIALVLAYCESATRVYEFTIKAQNTKCDFWQSFCQIVQLFIYVLILIGFILIAVGS